MIKNKLFSFLLIIPIFSGLISCKKATTDGEFTAYFGGEVTNPTKPYVLFCKNNKVIDTIALKKNNTFFIKFDSLTPGLYTFKNEPEYQYIYFDKNDSLMVHINSKDFDESIIFCGRGDEKNNFLMEMYLRNNKDKNKMFDVFDYNVPQFMNNIDSTYKSNQKFYNTKKAQIQWNENFDVYAKAALDYHQFSKKEIYPVVHKMRTGKDISDQLPKNYYDFRKTIDYNNPDLADYSPYIMYLSHMLNNVGTISYHNHFTDLDLALKTNINKLNIADTLIKNEKVKNTILNNIAFTYLIEDQNMINNQTFLETYRKYSTDKSQKNEITILGNAIQLLKKGNVLPAINFIDQSNKLISSSSLLKHKTIIYFWTTKANSHLVAAHKKIAELQSKYPNFDFIAINLDEDLSDWKTALYKNNYKGISEYHCQNFDDIKAKWAITKIQRVIVLDENGKINNAFANIFDINFEINLK